MDANHMGMISCMYFNDCVYACIKFLIKRIQTSKLIMLSGENPEWLLYTLFYLGSWGERGQAIKEEWSFTILQLSLWCNLTLFYFFIQRTQLNILHQLMFAASVENIWKLCQCSEVTTEIIFGKLTKDTAYESLKFMFPIVHRFFLLLISYFLLVISY